METAAATEPSAESLCLLLPLQVRPQSSFLTITDFRGGCEERKRKANKKYSKRGLERNGGLLDV